MASSDPVRAKTAAVYARADRLGGAPAGPLLSFGELDDWVSGAAGPHARLVLVRGDSALLDACKAHLFRRAHMSGRAVISVGAFSDEDPFGEAARRLSVSTAASPKETADEIALRAGRALLLLRESPGQCSAWGRAVAEHLALGDAGEGAGLLTVVLTEERSLREPKGAWVCELSPALSAEDLKRVWEGLLTEASGAGSSVFARLDTLGAWWQRARSLNAAELVSQPVLSAEAHSLLARMALCGRAISMHSALHLGSAGALEELVAQGAIRLDTEGRVVEGHFDVVGAAPRISNEKDALCVAGLLSREGAADGWALIRAAELFAAAHRMDEAERAAGQALSHMIDPDARGDFWRRWIAVLQRCVDAQEPGTQARLLGAVDLAIRIGDAEKALEIASIAIAEYGESYETALSLGRALLSRGDLIAATVPLRKAYTEAPTPKAGALAAVELSEAFYMAGDLEEARRFAELGLSPEADPATRLDARNLIGKLYLASHAWLQAEQHFAADAGYAVCAGDFKAELRAHLNRGIALYLSARFREARSIFENVLLRARARDELPAIAFALTNLATLAIAEHDYANALQWSEESVQIVLRIGDRVRLSLVIANLAELRANLGLLDEAEQTLVFGRKVNASAMLPARAAHFSLVAARIHLSRGDTKRARLELNSAFSCAEAGAAKGKLGECCRVAARVALEDGDLERAEQMLDKTNTLVLTPYAQAEVALLRAKLARAKGFLFRDAALHALSLSLSQQMPFEELCREANALLCHAALMNGDGASARKYLKAAIEIRDRLAHALDCSKQERFLARRELSELGDLERRLASEVLETKSPGAQTPFSMTGVPSARQAQMEGGIGQPSQQSAKRLLGREPSMLALIKAIQKIGPSDTTVLIQGESGTGKELVAEALHEASGRRNGPLLKVNCAALVDSLLISELFGHEKGSFTGAGVKRRGRFELADKGTLFLDEIGDISPAMQVALLRVLQHKTFERVGGTVSIQSDVRVVCATHRDLKAMVQRGEFREDLYYRLCGVVLNVPALRRRIGDLPVIASELLLEIARERQEKPKKLSQQAIEFLSAYGWPGNIRELWNALATASVFADGDMLQVEDFAAASSELRAMHEAMQAEAPCGEDLDAEAVETSDRMPASTQHYASEVAYAQVRAGIGLSDLKRTIERDCIARALQESRGNITRAAALLGMKRPRLSQLVKHYGFGGCSEE